jgi:hypothetical protein
MKNDRCDIAVLEVQTFALLCDLRLSWQRRDNVLVQDSVANN